MKKWITLIFVLGSTLSFGQQADSVKTMLSTNTSADHFKVDTLVRQDVNPLDIGDDRGLYILTKDQKMQLRILGSVRFSVFYDLVDMPVKGTFNTYYIPTGADNIKIPNFYSSLNQTRLGFEVTRKLGNDNIFMRLETDFGGANGQFRIRHAYGQIRRFLVGQTWSLFSNVSSLPAMVDHNGPTGSVTIRTPQIRYSGTNRRGTNWAVGMEYSRPDLNTQVIDTTGLSAVQMIPDFTARFERVGGLGAIQLSAVITTISLQDQSNKITNSFGVGGSLSGTIKMNKKNKLLYQITYGKSISHFITTFKGTGTDAIYNPDTGEVESIVSFGGFLSYGWHWTEKITTNLSGGYADLSNKDFESGDAYQESMSISLDTFWNVVDGARIGLEYVYGQRWNKDGVSGNSSRIWALFYYDF